MTKEGIKRIFSKMPNYDEKKTSYHVGKLFSEGRPAYGPPSCAKMKEHGLCTDECGVRNPVIYYRKNLPKK
jgi:DNA primase large subunit